MFEVIWGEAGVDKDILYKKIKDAAESGKKVFLFVPDQFTFEAEKLIYKTVKYPHAINTKVTTFSKISQQLLEIAGENKAYADDIVKSVIMRRVISGLSLGYYGKQAGKSGFNQLMLNVISRLRSEGISPSKLGDLMLKSDLPDSVLNKLDDIWHIYKKYDEALNAFFNDRLDDVRRAAKLSAETDFFKGTVCFFDGFDEFSGGQHLFIKSMSAKAERLVFTVTTDSPDSDDVRFRNNTRLITDFKNMSKGDIVFTECKANSISREVPMIVKSRDLWQECDWICSKIHELVNNGARYKNIAVMMPDKCYGQILEGAFKKYEIPAFIDVPQPLLNKSIVRFIVHTLQALSFETEDILRYIKSSFVRINKIIRVPEELQKEKEEIGYKYLKDGGTSEDGEKKYVLMEKKQRLEDVDIDKIENICRSYDLKKNDWLREFPEKIEKSGSYMRELEHLRSEIISPLQELSDKMQNGKGTKKTEALCDFICNQMNINSTIYSMCIIGKDEKGKNIIDKQQLDMYSSLWDDVVEVLESLYEAFKNEESIKFGDILLSDYTELVTNIFATTNIASPPQFLDTVTVGDVERSRFTDIDYLFICGVNQDVFPRNSSGNVLFTSGENEKLSRCGISIESDRETRFSAEQFRFYRCINVPRKQLFVTYSLLDEEMSTIEKSRYISDLCEMYDITEDGADSYNAEFYCRTEASAKRYLSSVFSVKSKKEEKKVLCSIVGGDGYEKTLEIGAKELETRRRISGENAKRLLLRETYSPSSLDRMNNCKFAYFCKYGLGASEELVRKTGARITGVVIHYCMESLLKEYFKSDMKDGMEQLKELSGKDDEFRDKLKGYLEKCIEDELLCSFGGGERFKFQIERLLEIVVYAAKNTVRSIVDSGFIPEEFEYDLSFDFGKVKIAGKCDRYDVSKADNKSYVRVVDYKRGKESVPMSNLYKGSDLQMFLYLFGICEKIKAEPSSVMYQPINGFETKNAEVGNLNEQAERLKIENVINHTMNGVIIEKTPEEKAREKLEKSLEEDCGEKKGGYSNSVTISSDAYESLKKYCEAYVNAMTVEAGEGVITAFPKNKDSCQYCDYRFFCGYDKDEEEENDE